MFAKIFAFWVAHPPESDARHPSCFTRYLGFGLALLGTVGIFIALGLPTMLVINEHRHSVGFTITSYHGYFLKCIDYPKHFNTADSCEFRVFPKKSNAPGDSNACPFPGQAKEGFTHDKQQSLGGFANFMALLCMGFSVGATFFSFFRGVGCLRSARVPFALSFLCGAAGSTAIIVYYVAINPCKKDICTLLGENSPGFSVSCWALSPVGQMIAMLMVFVGGCCSQRWAQNPLTPDELEQQPLTHNQAYNQPYYAHVSQPCPDYTYTQAFAQQPPPSGAVVVAGNPV